MCLLRFLQVLKASKLLLTYRTANVLLKPFVNALVMEAVVAAQDAHILAVFYLAAADDAVSGKIAFLSCIAERSQLYLDILLSWKPSVDFENTTSYAFFIYSFCGEFSLGVLVITSLRFLVIVHI